MSIEQLGQDGTGWAEFKQRDTSDSCGYQWKPGTDGELHADRIPRYV